MPDPIADVLAVQQVILRERQGRDRQRWAQMAETFHPDSRVRVSWFEGTGADFVAESAKRSLPGRRTPVHHLSAPIVAVRGHRALVEVSCSIHHRIPIHGVPADLTSLTRLLYRVQQTDSAWRIRTLDCVYESDSLRPVMPADAIEFDHALLADLRDSYRFLTYHFAINAGQLLPGDLYGDDRSDAVHVLYAEASDWFEDDR